MEKKNIVEILDDLVNDLIIVNFDCRNFIYKKDSQYIIGRYYFPNGKLETVDLYHSDSLQRCLQLV